MLCVVVESATERSFLHVSTESRMQTLGIDRDQCDDDGPVGGACCRRHYGMAWARGQTPRVRCPRFDECGGFLLGPGMLCDTCREHWRFCNGDSHDGERLLPRGYVRT